MSSGWGSADTGGAWSVDSGAGDFSVNGSVGRIVLSRAGQSRSIFLPATATDWDVSAKVMLDKAPVGGGSAWIYHELRRSAGSVTSYLLLARFAGNGTTYISASRVANGSETQIGSAVAVAGVDYRTGFTLRGQLTGTNPTTIRIKAWTGGEPATWQYTATDSLGPQVAGRAGLRSYTSSATTNAPLTVTVDDYAASATVAPPPPPPPPPPPGSVTFVGAGDIATAGTGDEATANLLDAIPGTVFTLGDNVYDNGSAADFAAYYDPTWGRQKSRTLPVIGNHEYNTAGAAGYFGYFGAAAGDPAKGYYSTDVGSWHVIALNANCGIVSCAAGSAQEQWLRADLASHPALCTVALWHQPRFSSGSQHGNNTSLAPFWAALYEYNADLVLNGHDHDYERFAPQDPNAAADPVRGIREFVVGTGGAGGGGFGTIQPNSQVRSAVFGVLELTLAAGTYDFRFVPVAGQTFSDAGSGSCH